MGSCRTTNTTTYFQGAAGTVDQFTLFNPANCSFPFNYKGKWHRQCIAMDDPFCRFWCSTENDHGYHRRLGSKWAYCSQDCRRYRKKKEMCTRKSDSKEKMEPHY